MADVNCYDKSIGLLKVGTITANGYNPSRGQVYVQLNESKYNNPIPITLPIGLFYNNGLCIGTLPEPGSLVLVGQGVGGSYHFVSFLTQNPTNLPALKRNELLIRSNDNTKITLDLNNDIFIGSTNNRLHINSSDNLISSNFYNKYEYTQATRHVDGLIKRDIKRNIQVPQSFKLDNETYESMFYTIGLDPMTSPNASAIDSKKNPPFVENRELVYEFQYASNVKNDLLESYTYSDKPLSPQDGNFINRRLSRADTLSLTLQEPNYLMETVKGTVIDIFGNLLDINRAPINVGQGQNTIRQDVSSDKVKSFQQIKELERKSLAYHFEINARKDLSGSNGQIALPDINSNADYARNRSRFFFDVDKEGQFKINVPASSETGNIPLLTRYENFSSFYVGEDGKVNPNKLIYREDNLDIFQDSFAAPNINRMTENNIDLSSNNRGSITIKDGDAIGTPNDRITGVPIKHGTAYHDILSTCYTFTNYRYLDYQNDYPDDPSNTNIDIDEIMELNSHLENIASSTINISGDNANAGGRSGSISLDGSLELNIGANTIDRQSLWLDCAGGIVANVGRDLNNKSLAMNMDGDVYIQLGGIGVSTDSRFKDKYNASYGASLDLRVITNGGFTTMIRIDNNGVKIMTPSFLQVHASQGMKFTSDADISIEAETLTLQKRMVLKENGGSI